MSFELRDPRLLALGWTLLHSLWQGLVVGLVVLGGHALARSARSRYTLSSLALLACFLWPATTLVRLWPSPGADAGIHPMSLGEAGWASHLEVATIRQLPGLGASLAPWLPRLAALWFAGVAVGSVRLLGAWIWLRRASERACPCVPATLAARAQQFTKALRLRRVVALRVSTGADGPVTHGVWRPVVLIPASLLTGFPPEHLEALLAHELAHLVRHDYLVNLLQCLIDILLFYHPVAWWISRRIRTEREHLCDDLAATVLGEPRRLARALNALEDVRSRPPTLALAARGGPLVQRIRRLVSPHPPASPRSWALAALLTLPPLAAAGLHLVQPPMASSRADVVTGVLGREANTWVLDLNTETTGPRGPLRVVLQPLGAEGSPRANWELPPTEDQSSQWVPGHATRTATRTRLSLAPTVTALQVTVWDAHTGAIGRGTVSAQGGAFQFEMQAFNTREPGWVEGRVERLKDRPGTLRVSAFCCLSGEAIELQTASRQRLADLVPASPPGKRTCSTPALTLPWPGREDRLVLVIHRPGTDQVRRQDVRVVDGQGAFRLALDGVQQ